MAEIMTVLVTVAMWIVGAMGVIGIPVLAIGLMASLSGGSTEVSGIKALADGVMPGQLVIGLAGLAVIVPGVIFICLQLRRILLTLADGDPFVPENASRLSRVGIAIAAMELIRIAVVMVVSTMPSLVGDEPPRLSTQFILWISVAALFVLSQVFREGTRLRDEEKMTI
ncbi:DUF2975 domain-containing protein [Hyphomonas sp.]|jgi:hypothetical protein|uniref:DUF2975 domain-containing protein n=2 Tax=Hyphomonas sp. TaxID=87 RepID=UPI0025C089B6|nr:DUF2975 domain-containing protein [Hyphomonas sp.]